MRMFLESIFKKERGIEKCPSYVYSSTILISRLCRCGHFPSCSHVDEHALFSLIKAKGISLLVDMGNHHFSHFVRNGRRIYSCKIFVEYM